MGVPNTLALRQSLHRGWEVFGSGVAGGGGRGVVRGSSVPECRVPVRISVVWSVYVWNMSERAAAVFLLIERDSLWLLRVQMSLLMDSHH